MGVFNKIADTFFKKSVSVSQLFANGSSVAEKWSATQQMSAYSTSAYVYSCVRLRAEKVGMVEFQLTRGKGESEKEINEHDLLDLLYKPNAFQNKNEFFENYQMHKDLTGSVFVYMLRIGNVVKELHLLRPDRICIKMSESGGEIVGFEYTLPNGQPKMFPPEEIIWSISPSPFSPLVGHSPLVPGQISVDTEIQLSEYQNKVLKNGGKVEGILRFKLDRLTQKQIEEIKEQFKEHYAEAKNAGKPLVLYGDSEYDNIGLTPTEMSYLESKRLTRDDILLLYRVPKPLLAQTDDVNLANAKMAKSVFLSETIKPLLENLTQKLNEFLLPEELNLKFVDPTPEDVELSLKKIESGIKNYYMTINEARKAQGLEDLPEGDQLLVPFNLSPLGQEPTSTEPKVPEGKSVIKQKDHPLRDPVKRQKYAENWVKVSNRREDKFSIALNRYWRGQLKRIVEKIDQITPKNKRKGLLDEIWTPSIEIELAKEWVLPMIREFLLESGQQTLDLFGNGGNFNLTSTLQTSLNQKADIFARTINETTFKRLKDEFQESLDLQENRSDLIKRIKETYGDISDGRAATIARTEVTSASQMGVLAGYEQSGVDLKIWVTTPDARARDSHVSIDGEERSLKQPFSNGLQFPGDPSGPIQETVNCRCSI